MSAWRLLCGLLLSVITLTALPGCQTPRASGTIRTNRPFKVEANGKVAMAQAVSLGEVPQHLDIKGQTDTQPVLLYMHGGPGRSAIPSSHVYANSLERHYVVVHWDQRGTQRSLTEHLTKFPLSLEQLVDDAVELSRLLASWFERERVVLVAQGMAALPALRSVQEQPDAFYALVLIAPIIDVQAALVHSYRWALGQAHEREDQDALLELQPLGEPPWPAEREVQAREALLNWLDRWGGTVPGTDAAAMLRGVEAEASADRRVRPELADQGEAYTLERLWPTLREQSLSRQMSVVPVPIFFIVGEADQRAPLAHVQAYYEALDARQGKTLVKLDGVGHWPILEAPERVLEVLAGRVWPMAR